MSSSTRTSGLSVAAFSSVVDRVLDVVEQVARRAVHLRRAAQRVRVLHLVAPAVRLDDRRALEQAQHVARRRRLPAQRPQRVDLRDERVARALQRLERERARAVGDPRRAAARARAPSAPCAAMNCVPLISDRPSFASEAHRLEARRARARRAPSSSSPSNHASPSPTSGSARCASGARSPDAPTEPRAGTSGSTPRFRHSSSSSTVSTRAPELPFASAFARSSIAARTTVVRIRLADAARVRAEQAQLQLLGQLLRDLLRDEAAEAGVDAVGVLVRAVRGALDDARAPRASARARRRRAARRRAARRRPPRRRRA